MADSKPTNPKDAIGSDKLALHLVPKIAIAQLALAMTEGALKYGKFNWRAAGVRASIYMDAIARHAAKFEDGEWADGETGVPHLASIMACCAIVLDSKHVGNLVDDRGPIAPTGTAIDKMSEQVIHLKKLFKDKNPHQHTIEDAQPIRLKAGAAFGGRCDRNVYTFKGDDGHVDVYHCVLPAGHSGPCR